MKIRGTAQPIGHLICSKNDEKLWTIPVVEVKNSNVDVSILDVCSRVMSIYLRFDPRINTVFDGENELRDKLRDDLLRTGKSFQHTCARTPRAKTCESTAPSVRVSALLMATGTSQRQAPVVVQVKMDVTITADAGNRRRSMARK